MSVAGMGGKDAGDELVRERGLAEEAARQLKQRGTPPAAGSSAAAYGEAKAEYDAVIAGLSVALGRGSAPASLSDLQAQMALDPKAPQHVMYLIA